MAEAEALAAALFLLLAAVLDLALALGLLLALPPVEPLLMSVAVMHLYSPTIKVLLVLILHSWTARM